MARYLLRRLANYAVMLVIAVLIAYLLASWSMDPTQLWDRSNPKLNWDAIYQSLTSYNVNPNTPILERLENWATSILTHWDWGYSPKGESVNNEISHRIFVSLKLVITGATIGMIGGVSLGAWTATRQYSFADRFFSMLSLIIISTPVMVLIVGLQIGATEINIWSGKQIFNFIGEYSATGVPNIWYYQLLDRAQHLLLPTISISLGGIASYSRYQRNLMLDTLGQDYVRTARAKGLIKRKAVIKHALRTALIPMATFFAFSVAGLFVGATISEKLYSWHGMGVYGVDSIAHQDINATAAVVAFSGLCTLSGALLSDILVSIIDPRVRAS